MMVSHALAAYTATLVSSLLLVATPVEPANDGTTSSPRTWQRTTPAVAGLDSKLLDDLIAAIREGSDYPNLHSLLIARHGKLVVEEYFSGYGPDDLHMVQSVTKSVTSSIVGIALEQGHFESLDEPVVDFFPQWESETTVDARRSALTLSDLLTMRTGVDYHERGGNSPHSQLNARRRGWDRFYLSRPMQAQPGTEFNYDSGGVILLSALLNARAGVHAHEFADEHLFEALQISRTSWFVNDDGHPHTGGGLSLRPRDMARFGQLFLQRGRWDGHQVVPEMWVDESTRMHVQLEGRGHTIGYGYLWWILEPDPSGNGTQHIYAAMGFRGQYIFVVPEHDLVIVVTGGTRSYRDETKPVLFLYTHILPAVHGNGH